MKHSKKFIGFLNGEEPKEKIEKSIKISKDLKTLEVLINEYLKNISDDEKTNIQQKIIPMINKYNEMIQSIINKNAEIFTEKAIEELFENYTEQELKHIQAGIEKQIKKIKTQPQPQELKYYVYTHNCKNSAEHHLRKYKHWAKLVTGVDLSQTTGYAFIGKFLDVRGEHKLKGENIIVEACYPDLTAYFIDETGYYITIGEAKSKSMSNFIDLVAEALKNPEIYREKIRKEKEEDKKKYDARQEAWKRFFDLLGIEFDMNKRTKEFYVTNRTEQNKQNEIDTYFKIN